MLGRGSDFLGFLLETIRGSSSKLKIEISEVLSNQICVEIVLFFLLFSKFYP